MRSWPLVMFLFCGCSYPEFAFDDAASSADTFAAPETSAPDADTSVIDTLVNDTNPITADTAVVDSAPVDMGTPKVGCAAAVPLHFFCADWEEAGTEPSFGWTSFYENAGGTIAVDSTAWMSARSMLATVPSSSSGTQAMVFRKFDAPSLTSIGRVDARVRLSAASAAENVLLFKLERDNHGASIWLGPTGLFAEGFGATYRTYPLSKAITPGVWYQIRLEATLKISGAILRVYIDDMSKALVNVSDASTAVSEDLPRGLGVGTYTGAGSSTAFSVRFDDVSLDWL